MCRSQQRWENLCREQGLIFPEESQTQLNLENWTVHLRFGMDQFCESCCTCKEQMGYLQFFIYNGDLISKHLPSEQARPNIL